MSSIDQARQNLALAHRLAVRHELNEGVWNHISLVSPENPDHLLISPGHTHWSLVRASNLALMDQDGQFLAGEQAPIRAGWIIHAPVHRIRRDAKCVVHVHSPYATALSIRKDVIFETRCSQQSAAFYNDVAYYEEYDGILKGEDEGERMAAVLGQKRVLILRNHGVLIAGPTVSDVYMDLYQFERACMYQILAMTGGGQMKLISDEIAAAIGQQVKDGLYSRHFEGMRRWMQEIEPDYLT